jgi:hypothetical protein
VAAHEIVHNLGGVQLSAPNTSGGYHCTDEYDRLCYRDASDVVMTYDCASSNEGMLDCNNDDYFHPNPPANSYLDTHWNVADSSFLIAGSTSDPTNQAPVVDAGPDRSAEMPNAASLAGSVTDDGMPSASVTSSWRQVSGPGTATFADPGAASTTATFSAAGEYVLELSGDDGELSSTDQMTVTVGEAGAPPTTTVEFGSSLNKKNTSRSFTVTSGAGTMDAELTFKVRRGTSDPNLTLEILDGNGIVVDTTGGSPVTLSHDSVTGGEYTFRVSGSIRVSFTLTVTHPMP